MNEKTDAAINTIMASYPVVKTVRFSREDSSKLIWRGIAIGLALGLSIGYFIESNWISGFLLFSATILLFVNTRLKMNRIFDMEGKENDLN